MVFFPTEPKDSLGLSDPKLNLISEASSCEAALLVEGKENTRAGLDFDAPKAYEGSACPSLG